jgi:hypothetical protein
VSCRFCGFFKPEHHDRELGDLCETCLGLVEYGVDREKSRIIKLLEGAPRTRSGFLESGESYVIELDRDDFIALIKGENK